MGEFNEYRKTLDKIKFWCGRGWDDRFPNMVDCAHIFWEKATSYAFALTIISVIMSLILSELSAPAIIIKVMDYICLICFVSFCVLGIINIFLLFGYLVISRLGIVGTITVTYFIVLQVLRQTAAGFYAAHADLLHYIFYAVLSVWITQWITYGYFSLQYKIAMFKWHRDCHRNEM